MSSVPAIGARPIQSTYLPANAEAGGKVAGGPTASASGITAAPLPVVEPVAPSADTVSLSRQSLAPRAGEAGGDTAQVAQQFLSNVARKLFGDTFKGATFNFDSTSSTSETHFSSASTQSSGPDGSTSGATLTLGTSASFVGKGTITTKDGQTFSFDIEVQYQASIEASASAGTGTAPANAPAAAVAAPDTLALTGKQLPAIEFPGSLDDLFKLLGRTLQSSLTGADGEQGNLSLRLLRLVNTAALLAPRAQSEDLSASQAGRNRALAQSYASAPAPKSSIGAA